MEVDDNDFPPDVFWVCVTVEDAAVGSDPVFTRTSLSVVIPYVNIKIRSMESRTSGARSFLHGPTTTPVHPLLPFARSRYCSTASQLC